MTFPRLNSGRHPARDAILKGERYYQGRPCPRCSGTERYIDGSCRECRRRYGEAYRRAERIEAFIEDREP